MIPALARWNGDHAMTKDTTKEAAGLAGYRAPRKAVSIAA
jgi:hypothetical protein